MNHPYEDNQEEIIAHMTPAEIRELSNIQGKMEFDPQTNLPSFKSLMHMSNHPEVKNKMIEWEGNRFAGGGEVEGINNFIRSSGRYGDTEAVKLPTVIANLFDRALNNGRPSINPKTGKREYFLGGLLGGLGNIFSSFMPAAGGVIKSLAPSLGNMAGSALGSLGQRFGMGQLGNQLGNMAGNTLGNLGSQIGSDMEGGQMQSPSAYARQGAGQFGQQAAPAMGNAFGQYAQNRASQMSNPYARQAMSHMGNMGGQMMGNMGYEGANSLAQNRSPQFGSTAMGTASNYMGQYNNPYAQFGSQVMNPTAYGMQSPNLISTYQGG